MNPEKLAKLSPHGVTPGAVGRGIPEITAQDVAGAMGMAKLSHLQSSILMVKYAGHDTPSSIWSLVMMWIGDTYPDWLGHGIAQHVATDAVGRFVGRDRCGQCEGTGEDWRTAPPTRCEVCKGEGTISDERRYDGVWMSRYRMILAMLEIAEEEAIRAVRV